MDLEHEIERALTEKTLYGIKSESPGLIYEALGRAFYLQKITGKSHHAQALQVLTRVSEFLATHQIPILVRKQILTYLDALGLLFEDYERVTFEKKHKKVSGRDVLEYLMLEHQLKQKDLKPVLGGQSIVSEVLSGKRKLNAKQVRALSKRFGVSPLVFLN